MSISGISLTLLDQIAASPAAAAALSNDVLSLAAEAQAAAAHPQIEPDSVTLSAEALAGARVAGRGGEMAAK